MFSFRLSECNNIVNTTVRKCTKYKYYVNIWVPQYNIEKYLNDSVCGIMYLCVAA